MYVIVDLICMGFLELHGAEAKIKKLKFLAYSGILTHDLWIMKSLLLPLVHET